MKRDMVNILNQLTSNTKLAGYDMLKQLLVNHYSKFKLFYIHLKELDVEIKDLHCNEIGDELILYVYLHPDDKEIAYSHFSLLNNKNFIIRLSNNDNNIVLTINEKKKGKVK